MINQPGISSITIAGVTQYGGSVEFNVPGASIDPSSGEIVIPTGGSQAIKTFTLDATNIANKYVILDAVPTEPEKTVFECNGLGPQYYGTDFTITADDGGKRLSWATLGLEPLLEVGDYIISRYAWRGKLNGTTY